MTGISAILFDKDGTLLDFDSTWRAFAEELALEAAGGSRELAGRLMEILGFDRTSGVFMPGSLLAAGTNAEVIAALYPHLGRDAVQAKVAEANARAAEMAGQRAVPLAGALECIQILSQAGFQLGIATNDSTRGAEETLRAFGIADLFTGIIGYDAVEHPKPAPDMVLAFARIAGITPIQIAMVGDNVHDLAAARGAGAGLAIGVLSGTGCREDLAPHADVIIDSVADLPRLLERHAGAAAPVNP